MKLVKAQASPNIAFIKYWGKKEYTADEDRNIALNPSFSMTLSRAKTEVILTAASDFDFYIQDKIANEKDFRKIREHVTRIETHLGKKLSPFLMKSMNNFPMGTGIASSASAFAAMTSAFLAWELGAAATKKMIAEDPQTIARLARRGSGSACRSLHGPFVEWKESEVEVFKSDWKLYDSIVIFTKTEKRVSSSEGHKFAARSPMFPSRLAGLPTRLNAVKKAVENKSISELGPLLEEEAEEMHIIMRENPTPIDYQLPDTKKFLKKLSQIKRDFYFTLDAGPNVHIISDRPIRNELTSLLRGLSINAEIWQDEVGFGPKIESNG
jgi:diphosphomevalonate decarboxylase